MNFETNKQKTTKKYRDFTINTANSISSRIGVFCLPTTKCVTSKVSPKCRKIGSVLKYNGLIN